MDFYNILKKQRLTAKIEISENLQTGLRVILGKISRVTKLTRTARTLQQGTIPQNFKHRI